MNPGDKLPPLTKRFSAVDLFGYGAATWDWHRMHWDAELARSRGLAAPIVDGQMYGAVFARAALAWSGPRGFISRMSFKMKAMAFAGDTLLVEGEVASIAEGIAVLKQTLSKDGKLVAEATTHVRLPA